MRRLYIEEMKRILRSRSTILFLAAALAVSVFLAWVPVTFERYTYEENGEEIILTGKEALAMKKSLQAPAAGEVTPEKVALGLAAYRKNLALYGDFYGDFPQNIWNSEILPYSKLVTRLHEVMADSERGLPPDYQEITEEDAFAFYERCRSHLSDLMKLEQKDNPAAQKMAAEMYEKVEMPFYFYPGYGTNMAEYESLFLFTMMFLCIMITAPIFCCEYQTGADDILRSTRHGRKDLAFVKILSALSIAIMVFTLCAAVFQVISNSLFGWECRKTSLHVLFSAVSLLNLNVGEMQDFLLLAGFCSLIGCVCFVLFVSAVCPNTTISTGLTIAFSIFPSAFYMMAGGKTASYLRVLLPSGALGGSNAFLYAITDFEFLKAGPLTVWTPWLLLIVPLLEIPLFLWLTVRSYCRRGRE